MGVGSRGSFMRVGTWTQGHNTFFLVTFMHTVLIGGGMVCGGGAQITLE